MTKSANELMNEILVAAVADAIVALREASKGVPNLVLRDIGAIHANTAPADLPEAVQASIRASVREAFNRLLREGYSVSPAATAPTRPESRRPPGDRPRRPDSGPRGAPRRPPGKGPRPSGPGGGGRGKPGGKPPRGR